MEKKENNTGGLYPYKVGDSWDYDGNMFFYAKRKFPAKLAKLSHDTYQIVSQGSICEIVFIDDWKEVLVIDILLEVLAKHVEEQFEVAKVKIFRASTGEEWNNYFRITPKNSINAKNLKDKVGYSIWHNSNGGILVSNELKEVLKLVFPTIFMDGDSNNHDILYE